MANNQRTARRYPRELRERAVRLVFQTREETGEEKGVISRVAKELGITMESLRVWVRQAEKDEHRSAADIEEIDKLRGENKKQAQQIKELERSNEILKAAATFFARELDPPSQNS